jgi:hypothetical protein
MMNKLMPSGNRPLWWIMQGAYFEGRKPGHCDHLGYAAELRAIAAVISVRDRDGNLTALDIESWLIEEAQRAEAGDAAD